MVIDLPPELARTKAVTERAVAEAVERMEAKGLGRGLIGAGLCAEGMMIAAQTAGPAKAKGDLFKANHPGER